MRNWRQYLDFSLVSVISLVTSSMISVASAQESQNGEAEPIGSRMVLEQLMQDPVLHNIYLDQQLKSLTHPVDRSLRDFFLSDPRLEKIYYGILAQQESFLVEFERHADVSMYQLTRGVTKTYDRLDHIVEETARDLGFAPEAIANRKIYIKDGAGSLNAFTVSGSQSKIIVVFHSALLEKMDEFEVRAVHGHEMGHIRAGHTLNGYLLDAMFSVIYRVFTQSHIGVPAPNESEVVNFAKFHFDGEAVHGQESKSSAGTEYLDYLLGSSFRLKRLNAFQAMTDGVAQVMLQIPAAERLALLQRFMNLNLQILREMNAPRQSIEFLTELTQKLPKAGVVKVDPTQMKQELSVLAGAISRAQEMSADRFGSSVSKKTYLASSMGKLLGLAFVNENREGALKALVSQAEQFYQNVSEHERMDYLGGSHPSPVLRTHMIMNLPSTPDIFFANPFISLLILQDGVLNQEKALAQLLALPDLDPKAREYLQKQQEYLMKSKSQVDALVIGQLMGTESRIRAGSRNPRFDNMLQFYLVNKENYFEYLQNLEEVLKDPSVQNSGEMIKALTAQKQSIQSTLENVGRSLMIQVKDALKTQESKKDLSEAKIADLQLRQKQIETALGTPRTQSEVQNLRSLRLELTTLPPSRSKGSRIPFECRHFTY